MSKIISTKDYDIFIKVMKEIRKGANVTQVELANILIKNEVSNGGNNNERDNYCNIYKQ